MGSRYLVKIWPRTNSRFLVLLLLIPPLAYAAPDIGRQKELRHLLAQDCGSCHGMTLQGGLGPPLLPESLRDKPDEMLIATVMDGRPDTPMPPWRGLLTEEEVRWLVSVLRSKGKP